MNWKRYLSITLPLIITVISTKCCGSYGPGKEHNIVIKHQTKLNIFNETAIYLDYYLNNKLICTSAPNTFVEFIISKCYDLWIIYSSDKINEEDSWFYVEFKRHTTAKKTIEGGCRVEILDIYKTDCLYIEARLQDTKEIKYCDTIILPLYPLKTTHIINIR